MCGIFGTYHSHAMDQKQKAIFWNMFQVGVVRGHHGTGLFAVAKDEVKHIKAGGPPHTLFWKEEFKEFDKHLDESNLIVGHHRYATKGKVSDENAHPFQHGHITLVHNGTIHSGLDVKQDEVDSDKLCKAIADVGVRKAFSKISGAYACVWYDAKEKKLFFLKNSQRPLSIAKVHGNFYWASERPMLEWLIIRNYSQTSLDKDTKFYTIADDHLHWFDGNELQYDDKNKIVREWETQYPKKHLYVPYTPPPAHRTQHQGVHPDFIADFAILSEEQRCDKHGVTTWRYICVSDDEENLVFDAHEPYLGYQGKKYTGELIQGREYNYGHRIDSSYDVSEWFYRLRESTIIEYVDEVVPGSKGIKTKDGYTLSKTKAKKFARRNCNACHAPIQVEQIPDCLAVTNVQNEPIGLICPGCTKATEERSSKVRDLSVYKEIH